MNQENNIKLFRFNEEGKRELLKLLQQDNIEVIQLKGIFYIQQDNKIIGQISEKFVLKLFEKGIIEKI